MTPQEKTKLEIIKNVLAYLKEVVDAENISAEIITVSIDDLMVMNRTEKTV